MKIVIGVLLVIIGIIGLLVPIMPGWLFIFPGLILINPEKGKQIAEKFKKKLKSISAYFE